MNGYYKGINEEISWHKHDAEETKFSEESIQSGNTLLFGRLTYEMMFSFWPTLIAKENFPVVAEGMNIAEKIVFSRTMLKAEWQNTTLIKSNMISAVKELKKMPGKDMTILGSGNVLTQLAEAGLIDEYQIMLDPVALGNGTPIFKGMKNNLDLKLTDVRRFKSGIVLLTYQM